MIQYILHALWPNPEIFIWCGWFFILKTVLLTSQDSSDSPWKWSLWSHSCFSFTAQSTRLTLPEVLCCWEQSSCFPSAFLSGYLLLSQQLSEAHEATLMECTKHFQTASVRDRHLSYFTRSASWSPCLDLHPGKLLNLWRLNFPPLWSLSLRFAQHMRTEVLQQCVSVSHCAVDGQVTNSPPANAQATLWFIPV